MYKRNMQGWSKHFDFFLIELVSQQIAFLLACLIRIRSIPYTIELYRNLSIVIALVDIVVMMFHNSLHDVLKRGYLQELKATFAHCIIGFSLVSLYMFAMQSGDEYSRIALFVMFLLHVIIGYTLRSIWKLIVRNRMSLFQQGERTMLAVLHADSAERMMKRLNDNSLGLYHIVGAVLDAKTDKTEIDGIPIVATLDNAAKFISQMWIDSVYIDCPSTDPRIAQLMDDCHQMALPVHYHVPAMGGLGEKQFVEKVGGTTVLTISVNYATPIQLFVKRCMDILGGIVGSILALLIMAIVGPIIKSKSPGPILYKSTRIGMNGKRFTFLKIRSMYMDADERKKELMEKNRIKDGMMFKLDFDPRIIGNEILPDGTKKTGIGEFIRKTSLDEFPQFFNVLRGDMSLVGTRPPTEDEYKLYKFHHRARLACKPGITGMWQVSGRSEITDFEEVVRLDTEYITNWGIDLDIKLLFKTIWVVLRHEGAM